jgi:hypothetical protein
VCTVVCATVCLYCELDVASILDIGVVCMSIIVLLWEFVCHSTNVHAIIEEETQLYSICRHKTSHIQYITDDCKPHVEERSKMHDLIAPSAMASDKTDFKSS